MAYLAPQFASFQATGVKFMGISIRFGLSDILPITNVNHSFLTEAEIINNFIKTWICVVSNLLYLSNEWISARTVAICWVFDCHLTAERLWVWSPGQEALSSCFHWRSLARVGSPRLASLALPGAPALTKHYHFAACSAWWGSREPGWDQNATPAESRALTGEELWQKMSSSPSGKAKPQFLGEFSIFSSWKLKGSWSSANGPTRRCKRCDRTITALHLIWSLFMGKRWQHK